MLEGLRGISTHILDVAVRELKSSWVPLAAAVSVFQHSGVLIVLWWAVGGGGLWLESLLNLWWWPEFGDSCFKKKYETANAALIAEVIKQMVL